MSRPELSNNRIKLLESVGPTSHVKASCWLNIEDETLKAQFEAYLKSAGDRGRPNVQLELVAAPGEYRKVGSFQLFLNEPRDGGGDGFDM
jgi:hypothetical protein|tara:strand:- start:306 stop:575 length:270 start_codon:yes stop_codon:yes gene_type:complete